MIHGLQGSPRLRSGQALRLRLIFALGREDQSSLRMTKLILRLSCRRLSRALIPTRQGLHLFAHWLRPTGLGLGSRWSRNRRSLWSGRARNSTAWTFSFPPWLEFYLLANSPA